MKFIIEKLLEGQDLNQSESKNIMLEIMSGEFDDAQISGFLIAIELIAIFSTPSLKISLACSTVFIPPP